MQRFTFLALVIALHGVCLVFIYIQLDFYRTLLVTSIPETTANSEIDNLLVPTENALATSSLIFVGDIMLGRHVEYIMQKEGADYPYRYLSFLRDTPAYIIGNFESAMPEVHKKTPNFGFAFSVDESYLPALKEAGFTHLSLANNHTFDYGETGLITTREKLARNGFTIFGDPRLVASSSAVTFLEVGDQKVALIGLHTLFYEPSVKELEVLLEQTRIISDIQIVYIHWGDEYQAQPNTRQRALAKTLVGLGVDAVIGHHPHVVQSVEFIDGVPVLYSLGNFIFDQYFSVAVQQGLLARLSLDPGDEYIELIPVTSRQSNAQPRIMSEVERQDFLASLVSVSDSRISSMITSGRLPLQWSLATSSETAIMNE